jgi:hypothetical protein
MANSFDYQLQSIDILERYIALLVREQDEMFKHLNTILNYNRRLEDNGEWKDKNQHQFTEDFVVEIQRQINATANSYDSAIERLKNLKQQYSQIIK